MWEQANRQVDEVFALMQKVRTNMGKSSAKDEGLCIANVRRQYTWDEGMDKVRQLATQSSTSSKRSSKLVMCLEKLGQNSDSFRSWLELMEGAMD